MVLRASSLGTPAGQARASYRNFRRRPGSSAAYVSLIMSTNARSNARSG
jgi:hypothetical protein